VAYDKLWQYNVADLTAGGYFPIDNLTLPLGDGVPKPITLACMGLGIPSFPKAGDIESNDDIAAAIKRSKGSSVNKSDILPTTTKAKKHLQKEVMRRSIISKTDPLPSPKNWKIGKCIEYLESHPTINIEHESILDFWEQLKKKVRDHFLDNSGGATATMWRIVRFIECALSGSLRSAFLKRNHQKTAYILDAKNSTVLPSSYYQQVADVFNSNIVMQSKSLSDSYGSPFEESVELNPPTQEHRMTGEEVQDKMVKMRATYMTIEENIRASGQGEGSRFGNTVKSYVLNVRIEKGKPMANGDATGYGFTRFKEEDVFDELVSVAPSSVAASMSSVPLILTDGKRGKTPLSDRPPKKGKTSDGSTVAVVDFLQRMERNMSLTETRDKAFLNCSIVSPLKKLPASTTNRSSADFLKSMLIRRNSGLPFRRMRLTKIATSMSIILYVSITTRIAKIQSKLFRIGSRCCIRSLVCARKNTRPQRRLQRGMSRIARLLLVPLISG
jgi:hypothetical protein